MKRLLLLPLTLLLLALTAKANPVGVEQAREYGSTFMSANTMLKANRSSDLQLVSTYRTDNDVPAFYVFNLEKGYVIVSADDCARSILAYSDESRFDPEDVPVQMEAYLQQYVEQVQYGIENHLKASAPVVEEKSTAIVGPLVHSQWGQGCFFNDLCPEDPDGPCGHVLVGCGAVAMAQIMYYWGYPGKGVGSHTYTPDHYPTQSVDFGNTTYQWDLMEDMFYELDSLHIDAVARLMWHCGVALDMDYSVTGSGTYSSLVPNAFTSYFSYSPELETRKRSDYSAEMWISMVKANLNQGWPIYYRGSSESSGHAFVCDGYDSNDMMHFNWGWNGSGNGYFADGALDVMDHHYNSNNRAIFNLHPMTTGTSHQVTVNCSPVDGGVVSGAGTYNAQEMCRLKAEPRPGYAFVKWEIDGRMRSQSDTYMFAVKADTELTAVFAPVADTRVKAAYYPDASDAQSTSTMVTWSFLPTSKTAYANGSNSEVLFTDGFEGGELGEWTLLDPIGDGENWAFLDLTAFGEDFSAHTGDFAAISMAWYDPFTCPDNYMITPEVVGADALNYFVSGDDLTQHHYAILVSTTGNQVDDFIQVFEETLAVSLDDLWQERNIDLPYGTKYVAFRHYDSFDDTFMFIDDVTVSSTVDYPFNVYRAAWDSDENTALLAEDLQNGPFVDEGWDALEPGVYKYGVSLTAGGEEVSEVVWSNGLVKGEGGLITVTALPEQGGTVSGGGFIGGGAECALSATPNVGYDFVGWMLNGVQVSTETSYTFTPSESGDYVALFALETYEVTSSADPEEGGEVTQGGTYTYGSQCTLMAVAKQDYTFLNWTKDGEVVSDNTVLNFEVTEDAHYVAHFYRSCTVTVSANPADGGVVGGGGVYEYGTTATVTVRTNPDYAFVAWTLNGVIVSREVSYSFEVTEDCHLVANLAPYDAVDESLTAPFVTYPNPAFAGEELNVAWPDELGKLHVEVYTAHGVLVTSKELGGDRTSLGNDLKAGVYLMKAVAPSGKTYYSKLVIEAR